MSVNRYATQAGRQYQNDLNRYLREQWFDSERLVLTGAEDEGDVLVRIGDHRYVLEAKREKGFFLASWVDQAELEAGNYAKHRDLDPLSVRFAAVAKRRGKGIGQSYVITSLNEYLRTIK